MGSVGFRSDRCGTRRAVSLDGLALAAEGLRTVTVAISAFASAGTFTAIAAFMAASAAIPSAETVAAITAVITGSAVETAFTGRTFALGAFGTGAAIAFGAGAAVAVARLITGLVAGRTFAAFEGGAGAAGGGGTIGAVVAGLVGAAFAIQLIDFDGLQLQLRGHLLDDRLLQQVGDGAYFEQ